MPMMHTLRRLSTVGFLAVALLAAGRTAEGNAVPVGVTTPIIAGFVLGTAIAYDPKNHVYLVVASGGVVWGRFVAANGAPLGNAFAIQASAPMSHFPAVGFSPDANGGAGGFLVAWHASDLPAANTSVHTRMAAYGQGGAYGPESVVNTDGTYWNTPIQMAYSPTSQEFLVGLARAHGTGGFGIRAVRVGNTGAAIAPSFSIALNNQYEDYPSVAYDPLTNQFLVSYSGYNTVNAFAFVAVRLVQAGTNQLIGSAPTQLFQTVGTWITDAVYNPRTNQFLVAWVGGTVAPTVTYGRLVNSDATVAGNVNVLSSRWAASDGMSVDYNPVTDTYFLVASTALAAEDGGVELTGATGVPVDNGFLTTGGAGRSGRPYPRIRASSQDPNWVISVANSFATTDIQLVTGTPSGNQPPPGPVSRPQLSVDMPRNNATVPTSGFAVAGWAADAGASSGTGVDVVAVWAFPSTGGAAILAGIANYGNARPDVAAYLGGQFTGTGYGLMATLPAGSYSLAVYAHSTVNNSWNTPAVVNVNVAAAQSRPLMFVDFPTATTISQNVAVGGWAVDLASSNGSGVDAVHVWAYPQGSTTPVFVGAGTTGGPRPDVGAWLGPQFSTAGFYVTGTLARGTYTLVVFAHSAITGTFNDVKTVIVSVK